MTSSPQPGQVLDLTITFGNQSRLKCRGCHRYVADTGAVINCRCGVSYEKSPRGYRVVEPA